jgi:hypothetical protein
MLRESDCSGEDESAQAGDPVHAGHVDIIGGRSGAWSIGIQRDAIGDGSWHSENC